METLDRLSHEHSHEAKKSPKSAGCELWAQGCPLAEAESWLSFLLESKTEQLGMHNRIFILIDKAVENFSSESKLIATKRGIILKFSVE